jgi:hypothetical protein
MNIEILPTDKGWRVRTSPRAHLAGYFRSYIKAEAAAEAYIKDSKRAQEKSKTKRKVNNA